LLRHGSALRLARRATFPSGPRLANQSLTQDYSTNQFNHDLLQRISQHYQRQGDSIDHSDELAQQELGWLDCAARGRAAKGAPHHKLLSEMVTDLVQHNKPLAYIIGKHPWLLAISSLLIVVLQMDRSPFAGTQPFYPLPRSLLVRPPTLIPRSETEHWLDHLASVLKRSTVLTRSDLPYNILDIGTGTGCIPLTLAHSLRHLHRPVHAIGVDQSDAAVQLARENITRCGIDIPGRVDVVLGNLFAADFAERIRGAAGLGAQEVGPSKGFDLVVSNPPYIPRRDFEGLAASVREWEDRGALIGELHPAPSLGPEPQPATSSPHTANSVTNAEEDDGLIFYRKITSILDQLLSADAGTGPGGRQPVVAFEVGQGQAGEVRGLLEARGYRAEAVDDQWGIQRLVLGFRM